MKGTLTIILINVIAFIALNTIPGMEDNLLLSSNLSLVLEKPWTIITVFFSHQIHLHIIINMALLFVFGSQLEKTTSTKALVSLYLLAGIIGSFVAVPVGNLVGTGDLVSGASAAVFGIVAAFAVIHPESIVLKSRAKWWALALFFFNVMIAIINPETLVGAVAHIAGIIVGLGFGLWLKRKETA
jgi:membrane associated rhomboid family serine protease